MPRFRLKGLSRRVKWFGGTGAVLGAFALLWQMFLYADRRIAEEAPKPQPRAAVTYTTDWKLYRDYFWQNHDRYTLSLLEVAVRNEGDAASANLVVRIDTGPSQWVHAVTLDPEFAVVEPAMSKHLTPKQELKVSARPQVLKLGIAALPPGPTVIATVQVCRQTGDVGSDPSVVIFDDAGPGKVERRAVKGSSN